MSGALDQAVSASLYRQVLTGNITAAQLQNLIVALDGKTVRGATNAGDPLRPRRSAGIRYGRVSAL